MFKKVLVANRGEIALRIIRTLKEMNIASVAVYSDADRNALHVRMADEAVHVGPAPSTESYLVIDHIIEACKRSGAEAVHPGYGFLSENPAFTQACADNGITFIGPDADAMIAMGSKTGARAKMMAADVPVVPGGLIDDESDLAPLAAKLGYPVMLKASAGGGGKGMRLVHEESELLDGFRRAQSEARNAFGDDTVYVEKAIINPRHIEIQILADRHGNCIHLFERDCSVQRRHQKVIEEAPSPAEIVTDELVAKMGEVAIKAAQAVNYHSAGTIEFLVSETGEFYFLEMNTRLQVEHPITEWITGLDLVRAQVNIAAGHKLEWTQDQIEKRGHAIECRVYAEDPINFLPSPGKLEVLRAPSGPGVRDDNGALQGAEIPSFYDPLVSKLSTWGATREQAIARMRRALSEYRVLGIETNIPFHRAVMNESDFCAGNYNTGYIASHDLTPISASGEQNTMLALAAAMEQQGTPTEQDTKPSDERTMSSWRVGLRQR